MQETECLRLFNGKTNTGQLQQFSETGVQWVIKEAAKKAGIKKHVTSHVLRHTYATHLLEMGLNIIPHIEARFRQHGIQALHCMRPECLVIMCCAI